MNIAEDKGIAKGLLGVVVWLGVCVSGGLRRWLGVSGL